MKTFTTDNRWGVGALEEKIPEGARAVYSARWIDHPGRADIVPDRQGFAYDSFDDRQELIDMLTEEEAQTLHEGQPHDEPRLVVTRPDGEVWMRRSGGYVYVAAWIE